MIRIISLLIIWLFIEQIFSHNTQIFDDGVDTKINPYSAYGSLKENGENVELNYSFNEDNSTLTFPLIDHNDEEMATYVKVRFASNPDEEKIMLLDIGTYMSVLFHRDMLNTTTTITYRRESFSAIIKQGEEIIISGYNGPYNQKEPEYKNFTMKLDIGHALLESDQKKRIKYDGIIGLASVANNIYSFSFVQALYNYGYIISESFRFNEVYLNSSAEIYQSSITFGFSQPLSESDYLIVNNTLPKIPDSDISTYNIEGYLLLY